MAGTLLDELFVKLTARPDLAGLNRFSRGIDKVKAKLDTVSRGAAVVGGALTAALTGVGNVVLNFERQFNQLSAVLVDRSEENLKKLRDQAKELGASTSKSATDALEAQTALARQAFKTNEIIAATPEILALSIAGNLELGEAAELVAFTLKSYRLEIGDTGKIVDDFATIASKSAFKVEELGPAFRQVGPLAAEFNVPIERLLAVMGELRSGGLIPEQVGTGLRNVIAILNEEPTTAVLDVFKDLGIDFKTMSEEFRKTGDITGVFRTLKTAGFDGQKGLELFGREAVIAGTIIAERAPQIEKLEEALRKNEGAAKDMQKVMEKGLPGAVAQVKSAFEGMILALGDAGVTGFLERAADKMTALVGRFQELSPEVKAIVAAVITAGPALLFVGASAKAASIALGALSPVLQGVMGIANVMASTVIFAYKGMQAALSAGWGRGLSRVKRGHLVPCKRQARRPS